MERFLAGSLLVALITILLLIALSTILLLVALSTILLSKALKIIQKVRAEFGRVKPRDVSGLLLLATILLLLLATILLLLLATIFQIRLAHFVPLFLWLLSVTVGVTLRGIALNRFRRVVLVLSVIVAEGKLTREREQPG